MNRLSGSKLVLVNTAATYTRMFICAVLGLWSSRWVLAALGQVDFGLYAVVAGIMGFLGFLTGAMTGSVLRHFAYAIGQKDNDAVNCWFNASLALHGGLAVFMVIIGIPFGWFMLKYILAIPPDRMIACHMVFMWTLVAMIVSVLSVPFTGMFVAKQCIVELSVYQFAQTFLVFLLALGLSMIRRDRLVTYAAGIALIGVTLAVIQAARCCTCFDECRFRRLKWDDLSDRLRQLVTFGGWTIFGALGAIGGNQGIAFLLNVFCGARMNTAFGIANQVSGQVAGVSQGILNAMAPEITASEGRGQRDRVVSLALRASKFTVLLLCMLLIPVLFEMDTLMRLWLKEVPPGTVTLCRVVLLAFLIDQLTIGYMMAIAAQGRISGYQATLGGSLICAPLIAWMVLLAGGNAVWAVGIGLLATRTVCSLGRLWWARQLMQVPMRRWFLAVPARSFATLAAPVCLALLIRACLSPSAMRMLVICGGCVAALGITGWAFGLDPQERAYLENGLRKARHMIRGAIIHT